LVLSRISVRAGVVVDWHETGQKESCKVDQKAEAADPDPNQATPEIVLESGGILGPEYKRIFGHHDCIDEDQALSDERVFEDDLHKTDLFRQRPKSETGQVGKCDEGQLNYGCPEA
jgi:hypothetical protein